MVRVIMKNGKYDYVKESMVKALIDIGAVIALAE